VHWEKSYVCSVTEEQPLADVYGQVYDEVTAPWDLSCGAAANGRGVRCGLQPDVTRIGEGFVTDLAEHPKWDLDATGPVVYRGRIPSRVLIGRSCYRVAVTTPDERHWDSPAEVGAAVIALLNRFRCAPAPPLRLVALGGPLPALCHACTPQPLAFAETHHTSAVLPEYYTPV